MMKELICIVCPKGCRLSVYDDVQTVSGNSCERGAAYGLAEVNNPTRTLTTTVRIDGAAYRRLPVKTAKPIPKGKMMEVMSCVGLLRVHAPVRLGDVILSNISETGVDLLACKDMGLER